VVVSNTFYFDPYLGKISNLTNIFFRCVETANWIIPVSRWLVSPMYDLLAMLTNHLLNGMILQRYLLLKAIRDFTPPKQKVITARPVAWIGIMVFGCLSHLHRNQVPPEIAGLGVIAYENPQVFLNETGYFKLHPYFCGRFSLGWGRLTSNK